MFLTAAILLGAASLSSCSESPVPENIIKASDLPALPERTSARDFPRGAAIPVRDLTLAIVGEVRGELEPCGCPTLPYGGFERRHTQLDRLKQESTAPVFHLDLGDTLVKGISTARGGELAARATEMLRMSRMVGVDLWIPGPSDLVAMTPERIKTFRDLTVASATWMDASGNNTLLPPFAILEKESIRVGVIALSAQPAEQHGLLYRNPAEAVSATIPLLPTDLDWVIAAGNIADEEAEAIAGMKGLSAVFTTRGETYSDPPAGRAGQTVIETPDRGRYLQVIHARLATEADQPLLLHPEPPEWRARRAAMRRGEPDALDEVGSGRNLALVRTIPLSADLDRDGAVSTRLERYQSEQRTRAAKSASVEPEAGPHYASSGACVNCHSDEFARWTLTGHAQAWRVLIQRKATDNPECIGCHTTAYGEPGGFGELSATNIRKFKGVQCEMCHGPMGGHPTDKRVKSGTITSETCTGCHDEANSPDFQYARYLAAATCQGGAPELVPRPPDL